MTEIRKWHVEKSQEHRIKGWKIIIDTIRSTTGSQRIESYYRMEGRNICNVVAITPEYNIVLVRQYRHGLGEITLEIPGGIVDRNEDIKLAAIRELEEETGYSGDQVYLIGNYQINPGLLDSYICSYLLLDAKPIKKPSPDESEEIEIVLKPFPEFLEMIKNGQIQQLYSINATINAINLQAYQEWRILNNL